MMKSIKNLYGTTFSENDIEFLITNKMGIELNDYSTPGGADSFESKKLWLNDYVCNVKNLSMHGICCDSNYNSMDRLIAEVVEKRFSESCEIALFHNIKRIVFHSSGVKNDMKSESHIRRWVESSSGFWTKFCNRYKDLLFLIENSEEYFEPVILLEMFNNIKADNIGICFDVGHAFVSSNIPISKWIDVLGNNIKHVHIHDNLGAFDNHMVMGMGTVPLKEAITQLLETLDDEETPFVLECDKPASIDWLKANGLF